MRKVTATIGLLAVLACWGAPVSAFEQVAPAPPQDPARTGAALQDVPAPQGLSTTTPSEAQTQLAPDLGNRDATGVRIPGLGSFNFLPKMDFGLELLYGEPPKADSAVDPLHDQDVTVRGTVKRRF